MSEQEPVSLTRGDLISGTGRGIFMSVDLLNAVLAGKSANLLSTSVEISSGKRIIKNNRGMKTNHTSVKTN